MLYTPAYISSVIFFIILLTLTLYTLYNIIYYITKHINLQSKYIPKDTDNYTNEDNLYFLKEIPSYNTAVKVALNNKNQDIFKRTTNNSLKNLLAFKYDNDTSRINHQTHAIDIANIDDAETKALNTFKTKVNVNSINPEFDNYSTELQKENDKGMSVITNLMNPSYYLVNPLNKVGNKDVLNVSVPTDINLNQVISDKIDAIVRQKINNAEFDEMAP